MLREIADKLVVRNRCVVIPLSNIEHEQTLYDKATK